MKSQFCMKFKNEIPQSLLPPVSNQSESLSVGGGGGDISNINFTATIWRPFIYREKIQDSSLVCGPLLGILMEVAKSLGASLTYIDSDDYNVIQEQKELINLEDNIQIVLNPVPLIGFNSNIGNLLRGCSRPLGLAPMVSILSFQLPSTNFGLHALAIFNVPMVYWYFAFWIGVNLLAVFFSYDECLHRNTIGNLFRLILHQPALHTRHNPFDSNQRLWLLLLNFLLLTFFFKQFISNQFLNFFAFGTPKDCIDSVEQLVGRPEIKMVLFEGEITEKAWNNRNDLFHRDQLSRQTLIKKPSEIRTRAWEHWAMRELNQGRMILLSDRQYLEYMFNTYSHIYPNLYRSPKEHFLLPFFMPINQRNPPKLNQVINQKICQLIESGLYNFWILQTDQMNKQKTDDNRKSNADSKFYQDVQRSYQMIKLADISSVFNLYLVLIIGCLVVVLCELFIQKLWFKCRAKQSNIEKKSSDQESSMNDREKQLKKLVKPSRSIVRAVRNSRLKIGKKRTKISRKLKKSKTIKVYPK